VLCKNDLNGDSIRIAILLPMLLLLSSVDLDTALLMLKVLQAQRKHEKALFIMLVARKRAWPVEI